MKKKNFNNPKKQKLLDVCKAKKIILDHVKVMTKAEYIDIENSEGRILSEDLLSNINVPPSDNAAVDGFGFNFNDYQKNKFLRIVGQSKPGSPFLGKLNSGDTIKVFTGSPILKTSPLNIDTIVMSEDSKKNEENLIFFNDKPNKGSNIRKKSEDISIGSVIIKKGTKIRSVDIGLIASVGKKKVKVYKKLKVGIFSTGNEIVGENNKKTEYQIFDSNKLNLVTLFKRIGCEVIDLGIIKDNFNETKNKLLRSSTKCDIIITTGGVAASETDHIIKVIKDFGNLKVWKLAIKPGRPIAFGLLNNKPFFGLPGNPVAVIVTFYMLIKEFIFRANGRLNFNINYQILPSDFSFRKKVGRTEWLRGKIKKNGDLLKLEKFKSEGSGILSSISNSEGIIELGSNLESVKKGMLLKFYSYEDL